MSNIGTSKKNKEKELKKSKEKISMLINRMTEGVLIQDSKGIITYVNPSYCKMLKRTEQEIIGKHWRNFLSKCSYNKVLNEIKKRYKGISSTYEASVLAKDGTTIPVVITGTPIFSKEGKFKEDLAVITDVTELKKTEFKLKKKKEEYRTLLEILPIGVFKCTLSNNGKFIQINSNMAQIFNYDSIEDMLQIPFTQIFLDQNDQQEFLRELLQKGDIRNKELILKKKDGTHFWVSCTARVKYNSHGTIQWIGGVIQDKTEQKIMDERQKQNERERKELEEYRLNFIRIMSHELRTPLTVIKGFSSFIRKNYQVLKRDNIKDSIIYIEENVKRLEHLINEVSELRKIEQGLFQVEYDQINISEFMKRVIKGYKELLGKQIAFYNLIDDPSLTLRLDEMRIHQALDNIVHNAINHTDPLNREIIIKTYTFNGNIHISIKDNGAGITKDNIKRIFDPYVTIPTNFHVGGTGIGLFITKSIIELHKGSIDTYSGGINKGTEFIINIPIIL